MCGVGLTAEDPYARAEAEYREQLRQTPGDWQLRVGLARVILWRGRYREAEQHFARLVAERPGDADALLGYAQAAYWWGDFREAQERYALLLKIVPDHAEAQKALMDLSIVAAPRYEISTSHLDDSQPYDVTTGRVMASFFSDPLTRWDLRALAGEVAGGENSLRSFGGGISAGIPRWRMQAEAWLESFAFPDGEREAIGFVSLQRRVTARSSIAATVQREPLLATAVSVDDHATATRYALGWRRDPEARWLAAANAYRVDYSDDNRGEGADAWLVAPLFRRGGFVFRGGLSAAWRDTELNQFVFTTFESRQVAEGSWQYTYTGVYDPYWTPHALREGRLILVAEWPRIKLHADGGYARDRAIGYGPSTGATPNPTFIFPHMQERSWKPWRVSVEGRLPLGSRIELRTLYRRDVTVFYRANAFEASLVGRL
ncbi:MAG TPA: tetratricopeptide repeat protein [Thermoanaerobaculia bacterium]|nr:tetratricopeptide repeat protein [Thermoanaerobaculia bacterium]